MKKRNDYSRLRYEQELAARHRFSREMGTDGNEPDLSNRFFRGILFPNFTDILLNHLKFLLCSFPALLCFSAFSMLGGTIFLAGALASMISVGPAMASLYHRAYEYTRKISPLARTSFFSFFRSSFRPAACCGIFLGLLWILCGIYILGGKSQTEASSFLYNLITLAVLFLVNYYTIMVMAQLSQFELPMKAVLKNAFILLAVCGWRGILPAFLQTAYVILMLNDLSVGLLLLFLGIPNMIITLAAYLLWPKLSSILLDTK